MLLAIKINDNVIITETNKRIWYGANFKEAEKLLTNLYASKDINCFARFEKTMFDNFTIADAYNLHHFSDSLALAKANKQYNTINYLHFLGFKIKEYPTEKQFEILDGLVTEQIIDYYWVEDTADDSLANTPPPLPMPIPVPLKPRAKRISRKIEVSPDSYYVNELAIRQLDMRGAGANIIAFEDMGVHDITELANANPYLSHFTSRTSRTARLLGTNAAGDFSHQIKTLVTLFAKTPPKAPFLVEGLATEADLDICTIKPLIDGVDYLGEIRKQLANLLMSDKRDAVLLFEFEVEIFVKDGDRLVKKTFPIIILKDIAQQLADLAEKKNFIIVAASGNVGLDFDNFPNAPWKKPSFTDLSKNQPSMMMIGATSKAENGEFVKSPFNISDSFDAYLYTDFFVGKKEDGISSAFYGGSSGAVAIAAGIIACLQGKAQSLDPPKTLSNAIIKKVFKQTFMQDYPNTVLTPTTLEQLWQACEKEL